MTANPPGAAARPDLDPAAVFSLLARGIEACTAWQRGDLAAKLKLAEVRTARPATLVCVVGEYKQGKSLLIDALVGVPVCPVDDDLATSAITAVHRAEDPVARVRRVVDGRAETEEVPVDQVGRYVTEQGDPADREGVELVEVGIPSPALEGGLTLVDTPGVGGILHRHTAATMRFLGLTDGVVFVTDASQELTASEVAFLEQAREACPTVLVAVTKIDLYPEWQRIVARNREHLERRAVDVELIPVSSALGMEAHARSDPRLEEESGVADLLAAIRRRVLEGAKRRSAERAVAELRWALGRLLEPVEAELAILDDPAGAEEALRRLEEMQRRLQALQQAGARWSTMLNDGFTDLRSDVDYRLRSGVRALLAHVDGRLEALDPASDWEPLIREAQESLGGVVADTFGLIDEGAAAIRDRIGAMLSDDEGLIPGLEAAGGLDVVALWESGDRELRAAGGKKLTGALSTSLTALRGGSSGMILLGMVGNLAGIALAAPASLGVAMFFGAKQVLDTRKTALKQRRQEARTTVRQYVDEVNLEMGNRTRQLVQEHHRALRDHFTARLQELSRSAATALQGAQESLAADQATRGSRAGQLREWAARLQGQIEELP